MQCKDMFVNYEDINDNLIPNNKSTIPYIDYDEKGKKIGYYWYQGDTVDLTLNFEGEVLIEPSSRVITGVGVTPSLLPSDIVGLTKVYNTTDRKAWLLSSKTGSEGEWSEVAFVLPDFGKTCHVEIGEYLKGKYLKVELYNAQHQEIILKDINKWESSIVDKPFSQVIAVSDTDSQITYSITADLALLLPRGIYYLECKLFDENQSFITTLLSQEDCKITVR